MSEQQPPANPWPWWFARDSRDGSISVTRSPAGVHVEVAYDVHWAGVTLSVDDAEALANAALALAAQLRHRALAKARGLLDGLEVDHAEGPR